MLFTRRISAEPPTCESRSIFNFVPVIIERVERRAAPELPSAPGEVSTLPLITLLCGCNPLVSFATVVRMITNGSTYFRTLYQQHT